MTRESESPTSEHFDHSGRQLPDATDRLRRLAEDAHAEMLLLDFPARAWVPGHADTRGTPVLNVLVVGAGQAGLAILAALRREQVDEVVAVDHAEAGLEGPWPTIARMHTLRTPKQLGGVDAGLPSLTFARWFKARFGQPAWDALDQVPRLVWVDYLAWVRATLDLPVRNGVRVARIFPGERYLAIDLECAGGVETVHARKVVLATGVEGGGGWLTPQVVRALPRRLWAHTSDAIDFARLEGKRVAVLGAGASAMDAAATALEHGASSVRQFCRRSRLQAVQPLRWTGFPGFMRHIGQMDDHERWRFMSAILGQREPFTKDAWSRVKGFAQYRFVLGTGWQAVSAKGDTIQIETTGGRELADFVICGTGVDMALHARPELAHFAEHIATWGDRFVPPEPPGDMRLLSFPYLSRGFAFTERVEGTAPQLSDIHCFNFASTLSCGPSGAAIRGLRYAVPRLVEALSHDLFKADLEHHWGEFRTYSGTEFEPFPTEADCQFEHPGR